MKVFFLIFLGTILLSTNNALQCINYDGILSISVKTLTLNEIKQTINKSVHVKNQDLCYVQIRYYEDLQGLILFFQSIDSFEQTTNVDIIVSTKLYLSTNKSSIENTIAFVCDKENECNGKFMFEYLQWLFNTNYKTLETTIRPLLFPQTNQTGQCYAEETNEIEECATDVCEMSYQNNQFERNCHGIETTNMSLMIAMKITMNFNLTESLHRYSYTCYGNLCNNQNQDQQIKQIINNHYDLSKLYELIQQNFYQEHSNAQRQKFSFADLVFISVGFFILIQNC
ncbi:hypothetical protein I4U23_005835 [Adineta vaga]|nr:hypothetical protein I4U23_005835 [Adineta vaga]